MKVLRRSGLSVFIELTYAGDSTLIKTRNVDPGL